MQPSNLYLVQSNFANTANILQKLAQIHQIHDRVIFMGETILYAQEADLTWLQQLYILENEQDLISNSFHQNLNIISYVEFADLCLQHQHCISFK